MSGPLNSKKGAMHLHGDFIQAEYMLAFHSEVLSTDTFLRLPHGSINSIGTVKSVLKSNGDGSYYYYYHNKPKRAPPLVEKQNKSTQIENSALVKYPSLNDQKLVIKTIQPDIVENRKHDKPKQTKEHEEAADLSTKHRLNSSRTSHHRSKNLGRPKPELKENKNNTKRQEIQRAKSMALPVSQSYIKEQQYTELDRALPKLIIETKKPSIVMGAQKSYLELLPPSPPPLSLAPLVHKRNAQTSPLLQGESQNATATTETIYEMTPEWSQIWPDAKPSTPLSRQQVVVHNNAAATMSKAQLNRKKSIYTLESIDRSMVRYRH